MSRMKGHLLSGGELADRLRKNITIVNDGDARVEILSIIRLNYSHN